VGGEYLPRGARSSTVQGSPGADFGGLSAEHPPRHLDDPASTGYKRHMARLRRLPLLLLASGAALGGCDDYYSDPPPATAASVSAAGDPQSGQPGQPGQAQGDDTYADTDPAALTDFHSTLDPHGQWVEDPIYGTVWLPNGAEVGADFSPYETAGHWAYDDDDYYWASDYDWGWAPFHYGRWVLTSAGWAWIPGRVYAGAWVDWRVGYDGWGYVGWAPMYPLFIWRAGYPVGYVAVGQAGHWGYCAHGDLFAPNVGARVVAGPQAAAIEAHTSVYGGAGAAGGRVAASPGVGGGAMHGPPPASLGIPAQNVAHIPPGDKGAAMARGFARPSTATKMGAHPPAKRGGTSGAKPKGGYRGGGGGFHGGGGHGGHR
jgi:hypothetical protein